MKKTVEKATPIIEYVKLVQELYAENIKLKKGQIEAVEYKKYFQDFTVAKTTLI